MTEYEHSYIDREARGSVVKAVVVNLSLPLEHRRANLHTVGNEVVSCDNDSYACGSDILLCACKEYAVLAYVHFFAENVGGYIGYNISFCLGEFCISRAENGVVLTDVEVVDIVSYFEVFGDVGEFFILGRTCDCDISVFDSFFVSLFSKVTGNYIIGFAATRQKVERNSFELCRTAALNENNAVIFGDIHQFSEEGDALVVDSFVVFASVAHFAHAHTAAVVVKQVSLSFLKNFDRQHRRAC